VTGLNEIKRSRQRAIREIVAREPVASQQELAERLGVAVDAVLEARMATGAQRVASLDETRRDDPDGETLAASLGEPDTGLARVEERDAIERLVRQLTPRERDILNLRFEEDLTQVEIAERTGISQMQVSRILRAALDRLHAFAGHERSCRPSLDARCSAAP